MQSEITLFVIVVPLSIARFGAGAITDQPQPVAAADEVEQKQGSETYFTYSTVLTRAMAGVSMIQRR